MEQLIRGFAEPLILRLRSELTEIYTAGHAANRMGLRNLAGQIYGGAKPRHKSYDALCKKHPDIAYGGK